MKKLSEFINEASSLKLNLTFDLKNDIYNILSDMAFEYSNKNKKFDKEDVEDAFGFFKEKFFE